MTPTTTKGTMRTETTTRQTDQPKGQHTPGPWSADEWAPGFTVSAPDSHYSVCHLEDCNNAEANARLIAAAPELLAALEALLDSNLPERCNVRPHADCGCFSCRQYDVIELAQAAIAKAGGT